MRSGISGAIERSHSTGRLSPLGRGSWAIPRNSLLRKRGSRRRKRGRLSEASPVAPLLLGALTTCLTIMLMVAVYVRTRSDHDTYRPGGSVMELELPEDIVQREAEEILQLQAEKDALKSRLRVSMEQGHVLERDRQQALVQARVQQALAQSQQRKLDALIEESGDEDQDDGLSGEANEFDDFSEEAPDAGFDVSGNVVDFD